MASVEWGEFNIKDIFSVGTGSLLSSSELITGSVPRVSAKSDNNGIIGYFDTLDLDKARHFKNL